MALFLVVVRFISIPETAPFASHRRVGVPLVELDVLDRVAQTELVDPCAPHYACWMVDDWHGIYQLFGIGLVRIERFLHSFIA